VQTLRNVAIIAALAFVVAVVPGGGEAADTVFAVLSMAFMAAIGWFAFRLYRDQEMTLTAMPDGQRALLFGAVGALALLYVGSEEFTGSAGIRVLWFALIAAAIATIFLTWRRATTYS
jgi:hypothetical protein